MVGYELVNTTSYMFPITCWVVTSVIGLLLYKKTMRAIDMVGIAGYIPFKDDRELTMKCRRYRIVNGKLKTYYTDEKTTGSDWGGGYYANAYNANIASDAPAGTKYTYLNCLREWGYSEEMPDPQCTVFGSPKILAMLNGENKAK